MRRVYESFADLADAMVDGEGMLHRFNCAMGDALYNNPCLAWQKGVRDFAAWLDHIGVSVEISDKADNFYEFVRKERKPHEQRNG